MANHKNVIVGDSSERHNIGFTSLYSHLLVTGGECWMPRIGYPVYRWSKDAIREKDTGIKPLMGMGICMFSPIERGILGRRKDHDEDMYRNVLSRSFPNIYHIQWIRHRLSALYRLGENMAFRRVSIPTVYIAGFNPSAFIDLHHIELTIRDPELINGSYGQRQSEDSKTPIGKGTWAESPNLVKPKSSFAKVCADFARSHSGLLLRIPMKVVSDFDLIPVTGSEVKPIIFGAKRRWRPYRA